MSTRHFHVAMLLKTDVRDVDVRFLAGCERVFFDDAAYLYKRGVLARAFVAGRIRSALGNQYKTLWYPYKLYDVFRIVDERWSGSLYRVVHFLFTVMTNITQLVYVLQFLVFERNADVYYVFDCPYVALFAPKKTILMFHNYHKNFDHIFRLMDLKHTHLIFPSSSLKAYYMRHYPILQTAFSDVLHNAVDTDMFTAHAAPPDRITFLFVSMWVKEKGIEYIPYVIQSLNEKYSHKIKFLIGGSTDLWSMAQYDHNTLSKYIRQFRQLSNHYDNVFILGKINRETMPSLYREATYLLFPSLWSEPFALTVVEALACGVPVITFSRGGTKEIIRHGYNGFIVQKATKDALYLRLENIIQTYSRPDYRRMSQNARATGESFSQDVRRGKLLTLLDTGLNRA